MLTNIFVHQDLHEMALYPCAYSMTFNVSGKTLNAILNQRSQDMLVANNWNVCQYAVLVHLFAQAGGFIPGELVHVIADAHIYDRHVPLVEELITREPFQAPRLLINPKKTNFYDFTVDDVQLEGYEFHPFKVKIPVAE
jgi:thymidylate synthase